MKQAVDRLARWLVQYVTGNQALVLVLIVGLSLVAVLGRASGEIYESVAANDDLAVVDHPLLAWAISTRTPALDTAVTTFTNLGGTLQMPIIATVLTIIIAARLRSRTPVVLMVAAVAGSLLLTVAGKDLIDRARPPRVDAVPPYETSPSFPSGHTLNSTVIAGVLAYVFVPVLRHWWARLLVVLAAVTWAVAMGLSRVWLGHHWFTDVVVGWTLGLTWLAVIFTAHQVWIRVRARRRHREMSAPGAEPTPP